MAGLIHYIRWLISPGFMGKAKTRLTAGTVMT